ERHSRITRRALSERVTVQAGVSRSLGHPTRNVARKPRVERFDALTLNEVQEIRALFRKAAVLFLWPKVSSIRLAGLVSFRLTEMDNRSPARRVARRRALPKGPVHRCRGQVNRRRTARASRHKPDMRGDLYCFPRRPDQIGRASGRER